jgi:hypothetical protein
LEAGGLVGYDAGMKLQFSIRDLLWLTVLCAVLVAWWLDHRELRREIGPNPNYTITLGEQRFGIRDMGSRMFDEYWETRVFLGPLGNYKVPFSATVGLVGFCCILATLIIVPVVLTLRWKKRAKG